MITSQYRIETGSIKSIPISGKISLVSPFEKSDFKDENSGSVNSAIKSYGSISLQKSPVLRGIIRLYIKYYLIIFIWLQNMKHTFNQ